jgi:hypothetical protein
VVGAGQNTSARSHNVTSFRGAAHPTAPRTLPKKRVKGQCWYENTSRPDTCMLHRRAHSSTGPQRPHHHAPTECRRLKGGGASSFCATRIARYPSAHSKGNNLARAGKVQARRQLEKPWNPHHNTTEPSVTRGQWTLTLATFPTPPPCAPFAPHLRPVCRPGVCPTFQHWMINSKCRSFQCLCIPSSSTLASSLGTPMPFLAHTDSLLGCVRWPMV